MIDSNTSETFNFGSLNGVRGFFTNPSRADDSFVPFKTVYNNANYIDASISQTTSLSKNIEIPSNSNHMMFIVLTKQGYNNGYLTQFSLSGDISNIQTIIEENKYKKIQAISYLYTNLTLYLTGILT